MKNKVKYNPFVSIICVTYNRRPFIPFLLECVRNQDYPASRYEVIIVDDGTDKIRDLISEARMPQVKYFELTEKMKLGEKRNYSHTLIDKRSQYITYFDDDDYHHPSRVSHAVEMLIKSPEALCAGSSEIYVFFKHISQMYKFGPYSPTHATAGTFTFKVELLKETQYDDNACLAEERHFLKGYTIPFVQLDPLKTILVVSHDHNTFDKRILLESKNNSYVKSPKTIESFIYRKNEEKLKNFFTSKIHEALINYEPGEPKNKPDVLSQMREIEEKMLRIDNSVRMCVPGKEDVVLSNTDIVDLINSKDEEIRRLKDREERISFTINGKSFTPSNSEIIELINSKDDEIRRLLINEAEKICATINGKNVTLSNSEIIELINSKDEEIRRLTNGAEKICATINGQNVVLSNSEIIKLIDSKDEEIKKLKNQIENINHHHHQES
jgi:glycosyltransferase involved in cell wall biosynthesis